MGTVLFSLGSCFPHCDAQALLETQSKFRCLKVQLFLSALRTHKERSFLLCEITTNLQGPQFSEVLLSSTHSFIPFLVKYCTYRDLLCAKYYLIYNIAITKTDIVLASLTVGAEKAVDYNGGEWILESDHPWVCLTPSNLG